MKKIILDVDTGIDDALGILLALGSKTLDVLGITTVSGNIDVRSATLNTLRVLSLINKIKDVPVYEGAKKPLVRSPRYAVEVHGASGMADQLLELPVSYENEMLAEDFMINQIKANPGEVTIVMTGPQTNLALALEKAPEIESLIDQVIVMGGVVSGRGNESPVAEFNIAIDPEAADRVFNASFKTTMVGLDVTKKALLTQAHIASLKDSAVKTFLENVTKPYMDKFFIDNGSHGCAIHDPMAVAVAIDQTLITAPHKYLAVECNSDYCDGMTICDFDGKWGKKPNVHVALEVDAARFLSMFLSAMDDWSNVQ